MTSAPLSLAGIAIRACASLLIGWPYVTANAQDSSTFQINQAHTNDAFTSRPFSPPLQTLWSVNLGGDVSYPVFSKGAIIVNVSIPGYNGSRMVALSATTGVVLWQKYIEGVLNTPFAAADNNIVFEFNDEGILQAFDPETGMRQWIQTLPNGQIFQNPPIAKNGYVYVVSINGAGVIYKISESTGAFIWGQSINSAPNFLVDQENIYAVGSCDIYSVSLATSQINWRTSLGCFGYPKNVPLALHNNLLFATDFGSDGVIIDAGTGSIKARDVSRAVPAFFGNIIVEAKQKGNVSANELLSNNIIWSFQPPNDKVSTPPLVVNSTAYILSNNGTLYVLDAKTGKQLQSLALDGTMPDGAASYDRLGITSNILVVPSGNFLTALTPEATKTMIVSKHKP